MGGEGKVPQCSLRVATMMQVGVLSMAMMHCACAADLQDAGDVPHHSAGEAMPAPSHRIGEHSWDPSHVEASAPPIDALERRLPALTALTAPSAAPVIAADTTTSAGTSRSLPAAMAGAKDSATDKATGRAPDSAPADEPMARALERALVREGGLVLPPGVVELESRFRYQHRSTQQLELFHVGGQPAVAQVDRKLDQSQLTLGLRFGLPGHSQLELLLPYASHRLRTTATDGSGTGPGLGISNGTGSGSGNGTAAIALTDSASGFGDIDIGWTKQWYTQPGGSGALASLRVSEPVATDQAGSSVAVGSSFRTLQGSLLFIHRVDPVVYVGGLSYAANLTRRIGGARIDPGDAIAMRAGALIALSPDTSLRLGLDLGRTQDAARDGAVLAGSSAVVGEFSAGFSFVLTPRTLLGIEAGIGLTPRSPDFRIGVALPVRF